MKTHGWCNRLRLQSWYAIVQSAGFEILQENIIRIPLPTQSLPDKIKSIQDLDAAWWWVLLEVQGSKG